MQKQRLSKIIALFCALDTQEEWDNSGVQIDIGSKDISTVLVALEVNDAVIDEAMDIGAGLIITHHPLIFGELKSVRADDVTGRYLERLIRAGISCWSYHTPFDKMEGGNNDRLAGILELKNVVRFDDDETGYLRKGDIGEEMYFGDFIKYASEKTGMDLRLFRAVGDPETKVRSVGICTGSGAEFIRDAYDGSCDVYVTGDVKYHDAQLAKSLGIAVLDIGHYGSERIFTDNMIEKIKSKMEEDDEIELVPSKVDLNPFSW